MTAKPRPNAPAKAVAVKSTVFIPQHRINTEGLLGNALRAREDSESPVSRMPDDRFNELVACAEYWLSHARKIEPVAAREGGFAVDSYRMANTEVRKAIEAMSVEPLAQAGARQAVKNRERAALPRRTAELWEAIQAVAQRPGTVKERWPLFIQLLEAEGCIVTEVETDARQPAVQIAVDDRVQTYSLKSLQNDLSGLRRSESR